jgi:hypothetical protein
MNYVIDGKKIIFNVSSGLPNYSQRNNDYILKRKNNTVSSINVCNTTSMCMASSYAGWRFPSKPYPQYKQEEDRLTAFCLNDKRVSNYYKERYPVLWKEWQDDKKDALPPNQVHEVLAYATNLWLGTEVVKFSEYLTLTRMMNEIAINNLPVVVSGVFPKKSDSDEKINHIIVLVGAIYNKEDVILNGQHSNVDVSAAEPTHLIFDDPWGDFMTGYEKLLPGNDIVCPCGKALDYLKPIDSHYKWGHTFKKAPPFV